MTTRICSTIALVVTVSIRLACTGEPTAAPTAEQQTSPQPQVAATAPALAIAPFDAEQAKRHQEAWAAYLDVPVEITNSVGMRLVLIPPGEFMMGSPDSDKDAAPIERPQHRVRITRPFYLGMFEVTQKQYQHVMGSNPSNSSGAQFPVEQVTWNDAVKFCESLSLRPEEKVTSRTYRLPTEKQWEYACRAGTLTRYFFGNDAEAIGAYAWLGMTRRRMEMDFLARPDQVGGTLPNAWGLFDLCGNVAEWCEDWLAEGRYRVCRGGSWGYAPVECESARRSGSVPNLGSKHIGFRVALDVPESTGQPAEGR